MLNLLNGESKSITSAALIVGAASLFSRVIGLLRDRILAGEFGAGESLDIYYAAFRIPDFLFTLLIIGALSAGFIPIFARLIHEDVHRGWAFAGAVMHVTIVSIGVLALLLFIAAPIFTPYLVPGFTLEARGTTVLMTRIMLLSPLFLGVSAVLGGILQTMKRFFVNAIAPVFYNIGIIIGALFFVPHMGLPGLAWGVVLGAGMHAFIQVPSVLRLGFRYQSAIAFRDSELRNIIRLMLPRIGALAVTQLTLVAMTIIASTLARGSLTIFNFANNIQSVPIGIFGVTYAIAAFPTLTEYIVNRDTHGFVRTFSAAVRQMLFFLIPATILLIVARAQIVRAVLGSGVFDWEDTAHTFNTLAVFAFGMFAAALSYVVVRGFWAHEDTRTPAWIAIAGAVVSITLGIVAAPRFGVEGLAGAVAIGNIVQLACGWIFLRQYSHGLAEGTIVWSLAKMSIAAAVMAVGAQAVKTIVGERFGTETLPAILLQGGGAIIVGIALYVCVSWILRSSELATFHAGIRRRVTPRPEQLELFEQ